MKCYTCGQLGHFAYRCLDKTTSSSGDKRVSYAYKDNMSSKVFEVDHIELERGENLMFKRVLLIR